jgi:hypothetical protein
MTGKPSILEQFNRLCEDGEGEIICPRCNVNIEPFYVSGDAASYIERDQCPICDCDDRTEEERGEWDWCEHCTNWCEERDELEDQREYDEIISREIKMRKELAFA